MNDVTALVETNIRATKDRFLQIVKNEGVFIKEAGFAVMQIKNNPGLLACDKGSIQDAVINVALTGTTLNPALQLAFLIPRKGKCCLDFSYRGLVQLAIDSGSVLDMDASVVHSEDQFVYEMGLNPVLKHKPSLDADPGPMIFVYAVAVLLSGIKKFIVLNKAEVENIRKKSQAPKSDMWSNFYDEACRKTAIKKLYKLVPKSDRLATAINVVNQHEGIEFDKPVKTTEDVEYKQPEFAPPEVLKEFNVLFDSLEISQAERDMQLGACGGNAEKLKELQISLFQQIQARKKDPEKEKEKEEKPLEESTPDNEGEITDNQLKKIQSMFSGKGINNRVDRLKTIAKIVGRTISTTKDLTKDEASKVIEELEQS